MISAFCPSCNVFHSLDSSGAATAAMGLFQKLRSSGQLDFEEQEYRAEFSTVHLYEKTGGKMFGVLVCADKQGNEAVLKAFSGKYNNHRSIPGWVPHLFDDQKFEAVIAEGNMLIHPLTAELETETDPGKRKQLIAKRKAVSHPVLEKLYDLYEVFNFAGEIFTLRKAFSGEGNIPTGTGDCCAPKLLNHAAKNGLKPISLAEFYMGKPLKNSDMTEGEFHTPCKEKCEPLLGSMLCGINTQPRKL